MSNTFPYTSPNNINETVMYAGSFYELTFNTVDSSGNAMDLSGATMLWTLSKYEDPSYVPISQGVVSGSLTNQKRVNVSGSSTIGLSGKYIQQYWITTSSGSPFCGSQGIVNIFPVRK